MAESSHRKENGERMNFMTVPDIIPSTPKPIQNKGNSQTQGLLSWKSGKGFLHPFNVKEAGAVQFLFPSPLDRIRSGIGRRERAMQLGLNLAQNESFEGNQSFPRIKNFEFDAKTCTMDKFRGDELNTFSFSPGRIRGSFAKTPDSVSRTMSFNDSWTVFNFLTNGQASTGIPSNIYNPNKAVVTIDAKSSEILVANDMACRLFGYNSDELCQRRLADLFKLRSNQKAIVETHLNSSGEVVLVSGKVIDVVDSEGEVVPVSLWVKKLEKTCRCLAVMEPVERTTATFTFDDSGVILGCDKTMAVLHGYSSVNEVVGLDIRTLIPSFVLPSSDHNIITKNVKKQQATGRTKDGATFPVSLIVDVASTSSIANNCEEEATEIIDDENSIYSRFSESFLGECSSTSTTINYTTYKGLVWVFANISGMITILPDGSIHSCNHYFALTLLGYTQSQLVGKNICSLIPTFYDDIEFLEADSMPYDDEDDDDSDDLTTQSPVEKDGSIADSNWQTLLPLTDKEPSISEALQKLMLSDNESDKLISGTAEVIKTRCDLNGNRQECKYVENKEKSVPEMCISASLVDDCDSCLRESPIKKCREEFCSDDSKRILSTIPEGSFFGLGRHRDGSDLSIIYQIKRVNLDDSQVLYCVWVSRDPEEPAEGGRNIGNLTLASSINSTLDASASSLSLGQIINEKAQSAESDHCEMDYVNGAYADSYATLQQIGKGAFGCVKMAFRNTDKLLVITKFIRKAKVYDECWVSDNLLKKTVPLEVSLLTTLNHPNIVEVLDVFENTDYFQMVMEKHGCGMDLFEFIDRGPNLDEPLSSFIFRQVTSAVTYLHGLNILHRDIKDENIILDEHFHIKLIDFGSATFMAPGKLFSTFCGTVEYCSPEVLQGNKYRGPELEMWSLGVTLYTLIFGENPFFDVDETIKAVLRPPFQASKDLMHLISGLLNPDPKVRFGLRELEMNAWLYQSVNMDSYRFENVISCSMDEGNPPRYYYDLEIGDHNYFACQEFKLRETDVVEDDSNL